MQETIEDIRKSFLADLDSFPTERRKVDSLKSKYFGRKGALAKLFSQMGKISPKERPGAGKLINNLMFQKFLPNIKPQAHGMRTLPLGVCTFGPFLT